MQKYVLASLLFFITSTFLNAQDIPRSRQYPQSDFRPPLDIAPALAGTFGEIRPNHFHSGLDYRTQQREGLPVYAAADGYVSRLRTQIGGGGNIIYLTHPNGYSTVYMHLQRFAPQIQQVMRNYQYRQMAFEVDFPLLPIEIQVKKGDIIAWSGNTGGTAGPHLHFEIRDSKTEETINAQLFGINIPDRVKPVINGLYVYRLNGKPFSEKTPKQHFQVTGSSGNYRLNQSTISLNGESGLGIMAFDQTIAGQGKNGIYSVEVAMDGKTIFSSAMERFNFANSRAVNSYIDYPALIASGRVVQKSFTEPGNPLKIYVKTENTGRIDIKDDALHELKYIIKDAAGNSSVLNFKVRNAPAAVPADPEMPGLKKFPFNQDNEYSSEGIKVFIPQGNLYSDINFIYSVTGKPLRGYSSLHHVHTRLIPVHDSFAIWIKPDSTLTDALQGKALIVDINRGSAGGIFKDGYVKAIARYFGSFYVAIDTIPPQIRPVNISNGKPMRGISKAVFKISDNLSGIKTFNASIDGRWTLMEYDQKTATLWHTFEDNLSEGNHVFQLVVTDQKDNSKTFTANFTR